MRALFRERDETAFAPQHLCDTLERSVPRAAERVVPHPCVDLAEDGSDLCPRATDETRVSDGRLGEGFVGC